MLCSEPSSAFLLTHLSIGKYGGIVALEAALDQLLGAVAIDVVLLGVHVEHIVVCEGLILSQHYHGLSRAHERADVTPLNLLSGQLWTNPNREETEKCVT